MHVVFGLIIKTCRTNFFFFFFRGAECILYVTYLSQYQLYCTYNFFKIVYSWDWLINKIMSISCINGFYFIYLLYYCTFGPMFFAAHITLIFFNEWRNKDISVRPSVCLQISYLKCLARLQATAALENVRFRFLVRILPY